MKELLKFFNHSLLIHCSGEKKKKKRKTNRTNPTFAALMEKDN